MKSKPLCDMILKTDLDSVIGAGNNRFNKFFKIKPEQTLLNYLKNRYVMWDQVNLYSIRFENVKTAKSNI